jgi:lysophospholipid acyltransferase (LPLAT)-like uncharacterized protein
VSAVTVKLGPSDLSGEKLSYRFLIEGLGPVVTALFILGYRTARKHWINREIEERFYNERRPVILAHYHYWDIFYFFSFQHRRHAILCGDRWGGDLGAFLMAPVGIQTVRRTTREMDPSDPGFISGEAAKKELIRLVLEEGYNAAVTVDGPRGPIFRVKHGIIDTAATTGAPILTMSVAVHPYVTIPTWDRMLIPLPFSSVVTIIGGPFVVPKGADEKKKEEIRLALERHMLAVRELCEAASHDRKLMRALIAREIPIPALSPADD